MDARDKKIEKVLAKYDEPYAGNVWKVQGTPVIYHGCLERIAAKAGVTWEKPELWRGESNDVAILVMGTATLSGTKRMEWSVGEARVGEGGNYRVTGKQAGYPWAMAEKRGKDRVILKLIELAGIAWSEEESDEFLAKNADLPPTEEQKKVEKPQDKISAAIDKRNTWEDVAGYMQREQVQKALKDMDTVTAAGLRLQAQDRMKELGWKKGAQATGKHVEAAAEDPTSRKNPSDYEHGVSPAESIPAFITMAIRTAKDDQAVEDRIDLWLEEHKVVWDELPLKVQQDIDRAADQRKTQIAGGE